MRSLRGGFIFARSMRSTHSVRDRDRDRGVVDLLQCKNMHHPSIDKFAMHTHQLLLTHTIGESCQISCAKIAQVLAV